MSGWSEFRWTLYAPVYDVIAGSTEAARRRSLTLLQPRTGEHVLVAGCGTGLDFQHLPSGVKVTAIDASSRMVQRARRRAAVLGLDARVEVMDAAHLALPDAGFDAAVLHLILAVMGDPAACMREVARVVRPGGRVAVLDKFVPCDGEAGIVRRALDVVTRVVATSLTTRLDRLVDPRSFVIEREEPSMLRGQFRIVLLRRLPG